MISAIILAAGNSVRMKGKNKLLLPLQGQPLVVHTVRAVLTSSADEAILVAGQEVLKIVRTLAHHDVTLVLGTEHYDSMTASIKTGLRVVSPEATGYMICLSDMPQITSSEFDRAMATFRAARVNDPQCIVRPTYEGQPGHPVIFSNSYLPEMLAHTGPSGCHSILQRHTVQEIPWNTDHVVRDIDTPEDYNLLLQRFNQPSRSARMADVSCGTTSKRSPTIP